MILGIHSGHDCGAAISSGGKLLAAVNEERITRNKLAFGVPRRSIAEAMNIAGVTPKDIEEVAIETIGKGRWLRGNGKPWLDKIIVTKGAALTDFFYVKGKELNYLHGLPAALLNLAAATGIPRFLMIDVLTYLHVKYIFGPVKNIIYVDHHEAHVASGYYTSGFSDALSVVVEEFDGLNAFKLDMIKQGTVTPMAYSEYPHSPGVFYSLVTRMFGYNHLLHAGKITGLASYGDREAAYDLTEKLMWNEGMELRLSPLVYRLVAEHANNGNIPAYFDGYSREDIAAAFQRRLEDVITSAIEHALKAAGTDTIILSGGVAANVKMNQRIHEISCVKRVYIHPGMSDCGAAAGAALLAESAKKPIIPYRLNDVFLGTDVTSGEIKSELESSGLRYSHEDDIAGKVANLLYEGNVVARVAGRMEYGPRALGARSILYHCGDKTVNDWLNKRLHRTEFMPFAPAVLAERAGEYFENLAGAEYTAEFMTITFNCTELMNKKCPAVVHVDNTARPQLVTAKSNPDLYSILKAYDKSTGIAAVINTSFNIHDEPIVRTAKDAIRVFLLSKIDFLAIGDYLVPARKEGP